MMAMLRICIALQYKQGEDRKWEGHLTSNVVQVAHPPGDTYGVTKPSHRADAAESLTGLRFAADRRRFVLTVALAVSPVVSYAVSDAVLAGADAAVFSPLLVVRLGSFALAALLVAAVLRLRDPVTFATVLTLGSCLAAVLAVAAHALRPTDTLSPFFFDLFLLVCLYWIHPTRWRVQALAAGLLTAGVFALLALHTDGSLVVERIAIVTIFAATNVLGITAGRAREEAERREEAYVEQERVAREMLTETLIELRVLRDILPICSHCRRVRDEHGAWAGLEEYVRRHTDSQFSHGICPDCAERHLSGVV